MYIDLAETLGRVRANWGGGEKQLPCAWATCQCAMEVVSPPSRATGNEATSPAAKMSETLVRMN